MPVKQADRVWSLGVGAWVVAAVVTFARGGGATEASVGKPTATTSVGKPTATSKPTAGTAATAATATTAAWSEFDARIAEDVRAGRPLVTLVQVPLCSNSQIHCGGQGAGDPGSPQKNLYWGRGFGVRRYFDETARGWRLISRSGAEGSVLEESVYARTLPAARWGLEKERVVEQWLVVRAVHGEAIESAVDSFYGLAVHGGSVSVGEGEAKRTARVHVAGYAGHNRLMDGYRLKDATTLSGVGDGSPIPSFVIACKSAPYFNAALEAHGSHPLVMTRDLVAPEGYVIEALLNALGDNVPAREVRTRVVRAYARWQRLSEGVASTIFAR